jgi:serine/threonine protein kinase
MLNQFIQELKISLFVNHPNVVKMYGCFHDRLNFYIVMEYMEEGSLYKVIKTNKKLSERDVVAKLN